MSFFFHWITISLFAGLLAGLSFSPFPFPWLLIPSFILFFKLGKGAGGAREAMYRVYPGMLLWNIMVTYWLTFATVAGGAAAILANAVVMSLPFGVIYKLSEKHILTKSNPFIIPFIWILFEWFHHQWDLSWPWLTVGNAFATHHWAIQYISITGILGISYWIVLISSIYVFNDYSSKSRNVVLVFIGVIPILVSIYLYTKNDDYSSTDTARITVLQPNYDSYLDRSGFKDDYSVIHDLMEQSYPHKDSEVILWPENAIPSAIMKESFFVKMIADSANTWNSLIVGGSNIIHLYDHDSPKVFRGVFQGRPYNIFNGAFIWSPQSPITTYYKMSLVPIVERIPFLPTLVMLDLGDWISWGKIAGFGRGEEVKNATFKDITITPLICYDSVFPDRVRQFVLKGANVIGIITNDGWWGETNGHVQHAEYAKLRAIEHGRFIARSANNGISSFIDPKGNVIEHTEYWEKDYLTIDVPLIHTQTFYTKYGNLLIMIVGFITLCGGFSEVFYRKKKNPISNVH